MEPHFLGIGLDPKNLVTSFGAGIGSQKGDEQFARLNVTPFRKWISGNYVSQIRSGAKNDLGAKTEPALNPGLDDFSELDEVPLSSRKNDIATLHIGFWFSQFQRPIQCTERIHRNPVVAPNIDATEHGDDHRHIETSV